MNATKDLWLCVALRLDPPLYPGAFRDKIERGRAEIARGIARENAEPVGHIVWTLARNAGHARGGWYAAQVMGKLHVRVPADRESDNAFYVGGYPRGAS